MSELHRFSRTELLLGVERLAFLQNASVAIFGLGGVGSHAAEALCRAGIGRLTLVDFDDICVSNINRQIHALQNTVGKPKCEVLTERFKLINPSADIVALKAFYSAENGEQLLAGGYDYVLDAIDHFTSKIHLMKSCRERAIPVISSMGAAMKLDPTLIRVADIAETSRCRMAKSVRKLLRKEGIESGIKVVYSLEEFRAVEAKSPARLELPGGGEWQRRVTLGSISHIPAIFGMTMAGVVINDILKSAASLELE